MKFKYILLLCLFSTSVMGFEFEGGTIVIPPNFKGPIQKSMGSQMKVYGFKKMHLDGRTGTLLQLSIFNPGQKFPPFSKKEAHKVASHYLIKFLSGVEKKRQNFDKGNIQMISISGIPTAKITWTGSARSREMEGVMYCYILNSKIISLHTQDFTKYKKKYIKQATNAFENIEASR